MTKLMKYFLGLFLLLICGFVTAQQLPQYSQYQFNDYAINPAVGGSKPYFDVRSNHRYQWIGITDAPRTYTLTVHGPLKNPKMGLGGFLYTDIVGPTRRTGIQFSYTYHLTLSEDKNIKLGLGLSFGLLQFEVDGSKITLRDPGDAVLSNSLQKALVPDAKFGIYLYAPNYYFGITLPQIMQNKIYFFDNQTSTESKLEDHYYITGGYKFDINEDFSVEPSFVVKYVKPAPIQPELGVRLIYRDMLWLGGAYRLHDAASAMIGYTFRENILLGYSYDFTYTNLKNYSSGTHEVMIGIRFITKNVAQQQSGKRMVD